MLSGLRLTPVLLSHRTRLHRLGLLALLLPVLWAASPQAQPALLRDIYTGTSSSNPLGFTSFGGALYFQATDGTSGVELWRTDGTTDGTTLVRDINPGTGSSTPAATPMASLGGALYFRANDGVHGAELWRTDGTAGGTVLVRDIRPGTSSSNPGGFTVFNGTLYFRANDGVGGSELWRSDGTEASTVLVRDIIPGINESAPAGFIVFNGALYFRAYTFTDDVSLWKTDGTPGGTVLVSTANTPTEPTVFNGALYFYARDSRGFELWRSDGTTGGTAVVRDINPGSGGSTSILYPPGIRAYNGALYFRASDGASGLELWRSDGTEAGTVLVHDIRPGPDSSFVEGLAVADGLLYFSANDGTTGVELWKTNGTGAERVRDVWPGPLGSRPENLTEFDGRLYFSAYDPSITDYIADELWQSDGTGAGTVRVGIAPGYRALDPRQFALFNGSLYFQAFRDESPRSGVEPWVLAPSGGTPGEPGPEDAAFALRVGPNPAAGAARVRLSLGRAQHARVEVYDALGRRIAVLHDGPLAAGTHPLALDGSRLPAGVYVVRAVTQTEVTSLRVTIAR